MAVLLNGFVESVGSIKGWLRKDESVPLPAGWLILDGSLVSDPDSDWDGLTLPDYRGKFLKGHASLGNANFGADTTYKVDGGSLPTGGTASHNLQHSHPAGAHTHAIGAHTHTITSESSHVHGLASHTHSIPSHSHTISTDGAHTHNSGAGGGSIYASPGVFTSSSGNHSHGGVTGAGGGGATGAASANTDAGGSHNHGGVTGGSSGDTAAGTGNTDNALTTIDNEPPFVGVLWLVKIK